MTSQRNLYMVGICSTVEKRAKRTWDTTVETTSGPNQVGRFLLMHKKYSSVFRKRATGCFTLFFYNSVLRIWSTDPEVKTSYL